jgi:hypothetical protein
MRIKSVADKQVPWNCSGDYKIIISSGIINRERKYAPLIKV